MVASVDSIFISDILNLEYRQGPELPELQVRVPRFPLYLLPL